MRQLHKSPAIPEYRFEVADEVLLIAVTQVQREIRLAELTADASSSAASCSR
ncbi:MAG: hypothetical protein HOP17_05890 [Acidobacteria bacterium]|nr:hypothetical protein [Acidobacteriota bacterium]